MFLLQSNVDLVHITPKFLYHFFNKAQFADTNFSYDCICHSDCETTYIPRWINRLQIITLFLLPLKRRMFMIVQGPQSTWIINCHYYNDSDHFIDDVLCEHNPVWMKNLHLTQNSFITELNRQQVRGHLQVFHQKYQSILHWICPCCSAQRTAAFLFKRLITVTCCCLGRLSSLLIDGMLILVWTWHKCIKC